MAYRLMVIDDQRDRREKQYRQVFSAPEFDTLNIWTPRDFERHRETPVDGYVLDIFLDKNGWNHSAASLLREAIQFAPRPSPVFLISQLWDDPRVLGILKQTGESSAKIVQYLAWSEFQEATEDTPAAKLRMDALRSKLLFELDRWHGRSGFRPGPDDTIRILLIADSQFGDPATDPTSTFAEHWVAKKLKQDALKEAGNSLPDLIVVAGDVTHSGRPDQFALAEERLALDLMGPLWGNNNVDRMRDRLVLVPGNHDVNLRFSACDNRYFSPKTKGFEDDPIPRLKSGTGPYLCHHDYALEPYRRFAHRLTSDRSWLDSPSMSWVDRRFLHCGIRFFVLNSVTELNSAMPDRASFSEAALRVINRGLADDEPESVFSIAVSHHGLRPVGVSDEKEVENWLTAGRDFFAMHRICLWLYGHYHAFDARSLNGKPFDTTPLWLVQAPTSRIWPSSRGFCILELRRALGEVTDGHVHLYVFEHGTTTIRDSRRVFGKG